MLLSLSKRNLNQRIFFARVALILQYNLNLYCRQGNLPLLSDPGIYIFWNIKNTLMAKQNIRYPLCIFYTSHPLGTKHHRSLQEERGSGSSRTILTTIIIPPPPSLGHRGRAEEGAPLHRGGGRKRREETLRYRPSTRTVFPFLCIPPPPSVFTGQDIQEKVR